MTMHPEQRKMIEEAYQVGKWSEKGAVTRNLFIWKFAMAGNEFPQWKLSKSLPSQQAPGGAFRTFVIEKPGKKEAIRIDVIESSSWQDAREALLNLLGEHARPLKEIQGEGRVGDITYVGPGGSEEMMIFVRANIVVRIRSIGGIGVPVREASSSMDLLYSKQVPRGVENKKFKLNVDKERLDRGKAARLVVAADLPPKASVWYKFMADGGEFFVEKEEVLFRAETPGDYNVKAIVSLSGKLVVVSGVSLKVM